MKHFAKVDFCENPAAISPALATLLLTAERPSLPGPEIVIGELSLSVFALNTLLRRPGCEMPKIGERLEITLKPAAS